MLSLLSSRRHLQMKQYVCVLALPRILNNLWQIFAILTSQPERTNSQRENRNRNGDEALRFRSWRRWWKTASKKLSVIYIDFIFLNILKFANFLNFLSSGFIESWLFIYWSQHDTILPDFPKKYYSEETHNIRKIKQLISVLRLRVIP